MNAGIINHRNFHLFTSLLFIIRPFRGLIYRAFFIVFCIDVMCEFKPTQYNSVCKMDWNKSGALAMRTREKYCVETPQILCIIALGSNSVRTSFTWAHAHGADASCMLAHSVWGGGGKGGEFDRMIEEAFWKVWLSVNRMCGLRWNFWCGISDGTNLLLTLFALRKREAFHANVKSVWDFLSSPLSSPSLF